MASSSLIAVALASAVALLLVKHLLLDPLVLSPLRRVPGPTSFALTKWRLAYEDRKGTSTTAIHRLHQQYGPVVRIAPDHVSFASQSALRTIYGPGSSWGRTGFYRMFDAYGRQNLFTFHGAAEHGRRKKLVSHAYSKSVVLGGGGPTARMVEDKARQYVALVEAEPGRVSDVFDTLHYYSLDNITDFIYGRYGSTSALLGSEAHRALIGDILDPSRRRLSWAMVHLTTMTKWLYTRTGAMEALVRPLLPMQKPATYTGIRAFALEAYMGFRRQMDRKGGEEKKGDGSSILERLWPHHQDHHVHGGALDDMEIASECADHFLAGIDTTSDSLMFLVWSLSQPRNSRFQEKLRREVLALSGASLNDHGHPTAEASDRCVYLNAVIKETLRLYAPLPTFEPRSNLADAVVDGYSIPAGTVVGMAPYTLHCNPDIFEDPLTFDPDRWLGPRAAEMNRWFWAFSSGGRMCVGLQYVPLFPSLFFVSLLYCLRLCRILNSLAQSGHGRDDDPRGNDIPQVQDHNRARLRGYHARHHGPI